MANIFNVARYILRKQKNITAMKLEKLCYYAQAWTLVWDEKPLFEEKIRAWTKGPVCPDLYDWHRGEFIVTENDKLNSLCSKAELDEREKKNIDNVLNSYGEYTAQELSDLTHKEEPWKEATKHTTPEQSGEITLSMMHEYYSNLPEQYELQYLYYEKQKQAKASYS